MASEAAAHTFNVVGEPFGWLILGLFILGYYFIATEEKYHINKAKPALFTGTLCLCCSVGIMLLMA